MILSRIAQFVRELICAWWGHDVSAYNPVRPLDLRPGHINEVPTPNLIVRLPVPEMPADWILASLPEERRNFIIERVMMLRMNPPVIVRHWFCIRCGAAW